MKAKTPQNIYAIVIAHADSESAERAPLAAARKLAGLCSGATHAVIAGNATDAAIHEAQALGFDHVWVLATPADTPAPQVHQLTDLLAAQLGPKGAVSIKQNSILLVAAGSLGEELGGSLAAGLAATPLGKCDRFDVDESGKLIAQRGAFGGRLTITMNCGVGTYIAAVRKTDDGMEAVAKGGTEVHRLDPGATLRPAYAIDSRARTEKYASLDGAKLVVSGGRGIGKEDGFPLLYELAAKLGGAVGASLPAIDAGWAPVARQVGQSGKYVSPDIYLAVGISGTPQHLAGIDPHSKIVAINKDAEAAIFRSAHIGVVADWQEFLPALSDALDQAKE